MPNHAADIPVLRDAFPDWASGSGIFDAIFHQGELPFESYVTDDTLDVEYFGNHSGAKFSAPVVVHLLNEDGELTDAARYVLADIILAKFKEPWNHLWQTNILTYEPIYNYNMTDRRELVREDAQATEEGSRTDNDITHGLVNTTEGTVYGFNAGAAGTKDRKDVSTDSGTTQTDIETSSSSNEVRNIGEVEERTRSGNIGVTTTQRLIEEERKVWMWNFFDQVYKDIDSVIALPIYDICRV